MISRSISAMPLIAGLAAHLAKSSILSAGLSIWSRKGPICTAMLDGVSSLTNDSAALIAALAATVRAACSTSLNNLSALPSKGLTCGFYLALDPVAYLIQVLMDIIGHCFKACLKRV